MAVANQSGEWKNRQLALISQANSCCREDAQVSFSRQLTDNELRELYLFARGCAVSDHSSEQSDHLEQTAATLHNRIVIN